MERFDDILRINFYTIQLDGSIPYDSFEPEKLVTEFNFGSLKEGYKKEWVLDSVRVYLLGGIVDGDAKITLKTLEVEDYPLANIEFSDSYILEDSVVKDNLVFGLIRPEKRNTEYRAIITFDYDNSDFGPGNSELQKHTFIVKDEVTWDMLGIDQAEWDLIYTSKIGKYSDNKVRIMIVALGSLDFANQMWAGPQAVHIAKFRAALDEYNEANPDNPLRDENGDLVKFEPES